MSNFGFSELLILTSLAVLAYRILNYRDKRQIILNCTICGHTGNAKLQMRGKFWVEVVLWLFLFPGAIYSVWRLTTRKHVCENCGATSVFYAQTAPKTSNKLHKSKTFDSNISAFHWPESKSFIILVVGESHYQPALKQLAKRGDTFTAILIPEPSNQADKNAIKVAIEGKQVGYLERNDAEEFAQILSKRGLTGKTTSCKCRLVGGFTKNDGTQAHYGVELDMEPFE